jgi:DNA adenine methylase
MRTKTNEYRPIVKWVGGKRQVLPALLAHVPKRISTYIEPFAGGAALFFGLCNRERTHGFTFERAILCDQNEELIACYRAVRDDVDGVIEALRPYRYDRDLFYEVRAQSTAGWGDVARGARFLFLNRTCFNGLWRVNSKGVFNVPFGRYTNPRIVDEVALRLASEALARVDLRCGDFLGTLAAATPEDFVYFDPPYVPVSKTANFTAYAKGGFGNDDQLRLLGAMRSLTKRKVPFMLSNADTADTRAWYREFTIGGLVASRSVNSDPTKRGPVREVIVLPRAPGRRGRVSGAQQAFAWESE